MYRLFILLISVLAWGQPPPDVVKQLAARILTQIPAHAAISMSLDNRSSLGAADAAAIKASIEQQIRAGAVDLREPETKVAITLSEDPGHYLLIAQMGADVTLLSWTKPPRAAAEYRMSLKRTAVWEQPEPILDLRLSDDRSGMDVLETSRLVHYVKKDGAWQMDHSTNSVAGAPVSRDPRGVIAPDTTDRWVAGRNYMDGADRGLYYSKAVVDAGTLVAGVDGRTRLFAQRPEPVLVISNWGSDIVAVESNCGAKRQVLATAPANDDSRDQVQAFEFGAASYAPVSEPLSFSGPVTALWPAESPGEITTVVRNSQTGVYEASRISVSCTQ